LLHLCRPQKSSFALQEHLTEEHPYDQGLPFAHKQLQTRSSKVLRPKDQVEEESFWERTGSRLTRFVSYGTSSKCRLCHKLMGGVHSREQHERDIHRFTTHMKGTFLPLKVTNDLKKYIYIQ